MLFYFLKIDFDLVWKRKEKPLPLKTFFLIQVFIVSKTYLNLNEMLEDSMVRSVSVLQFFLEVF